MGPRLVCSLRMVFAMRKIPARITCDLGRNFVKAMLLISGEHPRAGIMLFLSVQYVSLIQREWSGIEWKVLPTAAPWHNGGPESMIKAVKASIRCLPTSSLSLTEFRTVLAEIVTSINNWPLGKCPESSYPLTPHQLLLGKNWTRNPPPFSYPTGDPCTGLSDYLTAVYKS